MTETTFLASIEDIIDDARNGRMIVLVDDEDRENEGDLVIPAQMATPAAINFMATYGRGLICLPITGKRADQLGLELMSRNNQSRHQTAFTVSIEALEGVSTGISAADRARSIAVAIDAAKKPPKPAYVHPELKQVPVNFLADLDITGGNSGSATLDAKGNLVGLAFDGNYEAMASDWVFIPSITRSIHVDIRYVLWMMDQAYGADRLLKEMGVARSR